MQFFFFKVRRIAMHFLLQVYIISLFGPLSRLFYNFETKSIFQTNITIIQLRVYSVKY